MRPARIGSMLFFLSLALIGCTTSSSIVTGTVRPAISPEEVRLYLEPPSRYETIGIVEASSDVGFSSQMAVDRAVNRLKSRAARIGANGVLLMGVEDVSTDTVGFYADGVFFAGTSRRKTVSGRAVFVIEE